MSDPEPKTLTVSRSTAEPDAPTSPISRSWNSSLETITWSNVAVLSTDRSWLVTARPTAGMLGNETSVEPMNCHCWPSVDMNPLNVLPCRCSFSQIGNCDADPATNDIDAPDVGR